MGILEIKDIGIRFGGLQALGDVNLSVKENTCHAIIGPNGAGKSTLLNCLIGKLIPDSGSVMFDGQSVLGRTPHEINQLGISRVFQTPEIFGDLTVMENMMIPIFAKRDGAFELNAINAVTREVDVVEAAEKMLIEMNMADKRDMNAASMSRGDKRRLEIGMCLSQNPKLLLLDEPTAGMARADGHEAGHGDGSCPSRRPSHDGGRVVRRPVQRRKRAGVRCRHRRASQRRHEL